MKKTGRIGSLILAFLIALGMLCGCGSETKGEAYRGSDAYENSAGVLESANSKSSGTAEQVANNRKIIEYITLTVETKTFDKLIDDVNGAVKEAGGYIESSEISGNRYYGTDSRSAELKIRIPKARQTDFSDFMSENSNVVNRSINTDDVTDQYIDTQSRIRALTLEKETLEKLLTESSTVADTLTVYEKLTDVIAQIESYQGKLDLMDNLVDYTTFTVYIDEVERETNVQKQNWFASTWNGFLDSFADVGHGLLDFLSFLIIKLPYLIVLAVFAAVILLIVWIAKKRKAKKRRLVNPNPQEK